MGSNKPTKIAINYDDDYTEHMGKTHNGYQFFLTTPFEPAIGEKEGCEYIALYKFDQSGKLMDSIIESFGPRSTMNTQKRDEMYKSIIESLGEVEFCRIEIEPFSILKYGIEFGLIARKMEDQNDNWTVELMPGNYLSFFEPWDSGEFYT